MFVYETWSRLASASPHGQHRFDPRSRLSVTLETTHYTDLKIWNSHPHLHHHQRGRIQPQRCWPDRPGRRRCSPKERCDVRTRTEPYFLHKQTRKHKHKISTQTHKVAAGPSIYSGITITRHSGWITILQPASAATIIIFSKRWIQNVKTYCGSSSATSSHCRGCQTAGKSR